MKLSRELKTAFILLAGIVLFIFGFNYLKSRSVFGSDKHYYAVYDHIGGLTTGTAISINGFSVGKITNIRFLDKTGNLLVTFTVNSDFKFTKNSIAELYDTGIIGGKGVQIIPVFDNSEEAKPGDTLKTNIKLGITELLTNQITPLQEKLGTMLANADTLLINVNTLLDKDTKSNIKSSIESLNTIFYNLRKASASVDGLIADNRQKLDSTLGSVENLTANLSKVSDTLATVNLGEMMEDLQVTINNAKSILSKIDRGEGSIGKLLKDEKLYDDLTGASEQLELLLEDLRLNPKRYVHFSLFGKKQKVYESNIAKENKSTIEKEETEKN